MVPIRKRLTCSLHDPGLTMDGKQLVDSRIPHRLLYHQILLLVTSEWAERFAEERKEEFREHILGKFRVAREDMLDKTIQILRGIYRDMDNYSAMHIAITLSCYASHGRRRYEVMPGLAQLLKHTEVRGLKMSDFQMPYNGIFLKVPKSAGLVMPGQKNALVDSMVGSIVSHPWTTGVRRICLIVSSDPDAEEARKGAYVTDAGLYVDSPWHVIGTPLEDEERIDDMLEKVGSDSRSEKSAAEACRDCLKWFINVVLYATMPTAEAVEDFVDKEAKQLWNRIQKLDRKSKKRRNLQSKLSAVGTSKMTKLGGSIIVDRTRGYGSGESGPGDKLTVRTLVTGHWRMQPYGPKNLLRKRRWIEPFWRGPEDGPVSLKPHILSHDPTNKPEENDDEQASG
jgi:hypothetical protein